MALAEVTAVQMVAAERKDRSCPGVEAGGGCQAHTYKVQVIPRRARRWEQKWALGRQQAKGREKGLPAHTWALRADTQAQADC